MDRSLDSIGSCSLDVDADSSDISDTSGSLNFPTPLSVKDITREFTANIRERCVVRSTNHHIAHSTTAYVNPTSGQVCMIVNKPPNAGGATGENNLSSSKLQQVSTGVVVVDPSAYDKKPSYLNLACCVNGYSNLTTYDSKVRQDINKSREVSPIRPSTSSLQYCKKYNSLAAPVLLKMPNVGPNQGSTPLTKQPATVSNKYSLHETNNNNNNSNHNNYQENGIESDHHINVNGAGNKSGSFIQQRVERLYGPGALAQGFYSPKKQFSPRSGATHNRESADSQKNSSELLRKFKQVSPRKDYSEFRRKMDHNASTAANARQTNNVDSSAAAVGGSAVVSNESDVDLPVFRHLSQEFRAQLPTVSPKRNVLRVSPPKDLHSVNGNGNGNGNGNCGPAAPDVVDHKIPSSIMVNEIPITDSEHFVMTTKVKRDDLPTSVVEAKAIEEKITPIKDGNYFLKELKNEQARLLLMAAQVEKYIDVLSNNPEISEDVLGFLRSAAGKARLLVSQKMKQFEGLCHNNLNRSPEDKFPTTVDDLQGFWDMVFLQVDHVDSIFAEVEKLKSNDWKRVNEPEPVANSAPNKFQKTIKTGNAKPKSSNATANMNSTKSDAAKSAAVLKREAQRKLLMEMKRKNREALAAANASSSVEEDECNKGNSNEAAAEGDSKFITAHNSDS